MIIKISNKIANYYFNNCSSKYSYEIYQYAFFLIISGVFFTVEAMLIGIALETFLEVMLFWCIFIAIRLFAGGFHANKEAICEIITTISIVLCALIIKSSKEHDIKMLLLIMAVLSGVSIILFSPLDSPEKPLSEKEKAKYRRTSWIILLLIAIAIAISIYFKIEIILVPSCLALILESILLLAGRIKQRTIRVYE